MSDNHKEAEADDMLPEYDFSGGVRGKYAERYRAGTNIVVLSPDVARAFPTEDSVNEALRSLIPNEDEPASTLK